MDTLLSDFEWQETLQHKVTGNVGEAKGLVNDIDRSVLESFVTDKTSIGGKNLTKFVWVGCHIMQICLNFF